MAFGKQDNHTHGVATETRESTGGGHTLQEAAPVLFLAAPGLQALCSAALDSRDVQVVASTTGSWQYPGAPSLDSQPSWSELGQFLPKYCLEDLFLPPPRMKMDLSNLKLKGNYLEWMKDFYVRS